MNRGWGRGQRERERERERDREREREKERERDRQTDRQTDRGERERDTHRGRELGKGERDSERKGGGGVSNEGCFRNTEVVGDTQVPIESQVSVTRPGASVHISADCGTERLPATEKVLCTGKGPCAQLTSVSKPAVRVGGRASSLTHHAA